MERDHRAERHAQSVRDKAFHLENRLHNISIATARVGKVFLINGVARLPVKRTLFKWRPH